MTNLCEGTRQTGAPPVYQKHGSLTKNYRESDLPSDTQVFNGRGTLTVQR